jgi:hypothetical protein
VGFWVTEIENLVECKNMKKTDFLKDHWPWWLGFLLLLGANFIEGGVGIFISLLDFVPLFYCGSLPCPEKNKLP